MIKSFRDFDVKEYKLNAILEDLDSKLESVEFDDTLLDKPISEDKFLLKFAKVVMNAFRKNGIYDYMPYGYLVYMNDTPSVLFQHIENENKGILIGRRGYVKFISLFDNFTFGEENTATVTFTSEKVGLSDMINFAIDDIVGVSDVEEDVQVNEARGGKSDGFRAAAGYTSGNIEKFKTFSKEIKNFLVELLKTNSYQIGRCISEITASYKTDPMCADLVEAIGSTSASTIRYYVAMTKDAMTDPVPYPEVEGILESHLKVGIGKTVSEVYDVDEYESAKEEERKKMIAEQEKVFEDNIQTIKDITDTFCHYVKNNGQLDDDDQSSFLSRGLYVTGRAGVGKSYAVDETLKKNGMVKNRDYIDVGNGATTATALYKTMYKYNGKLIILDDAANVVSGANRIAFWKSLLQTNPKETKWPRETATNGKTPAFYEVTGKTRQERYYAEIGAKSEEEKKEFFNKKKRMWRKSEDGDYDVYLKNIEDEWNELKKNTKPLIPDEFVFDGCVIVIGNMTPEELRQSVMKDGGKRDWDAISQRFQPIEINPPSESLWKAIQKQIRTQQSTSEEELPDSMCLIPREYVDEFIDEVNMLLSGEEGPDYQNISWRMACQIGQALKGEKGRRMWKSRLRAVMQTS